MRYTLNPGNQFGRFVRTIRVAGREPRFTEFKAGEVVTLDDAEQAFMACEIAALIVVPAAHSRPARG